MTVLKNLIVSSVSIPPLLSPERPNRTLQDMGRPQPDCLVLLLTLWNQEDTLSWMQAKTREFII
jgi:hypothetical protein